MKYIKNFETESLYQAAQATLDKPNVSLIQTLMEVRYLPQTTPAVQQHDYVEIAGIKWATMNLGANSVTDPGLLYTWGDTEGFTADFLYESIIENNTYPGHNYYVNNTYTKYNATDGLITLQYSDDAATVAWGNCWRTPNVSEWSSLIEATTQEWTNNYLNSGIAGYIFTDRIDNSKILFMPSLITDINSSSMKIDYYLQSYLSNTIDGESNNETCVQLWFDQSNLTNNSVSRGSYAHVRAVLDEYEYVELAGIKWANKNLGANSITGTGLYYQWGDIQGYTTAQVGNGEGQKYFGLDDYKFYDSENAEYTKYNATDGLITLESTDDAVTATLGSNWRMPTADEFSILGQAIEDGDVLSTWTNNYNGSGVAGYILTDANDSSKVLFLPAINKIDGDNINYDNNDLGVNYLSSSLCSDCGIDLAYVISSHYSGLTHIDFGIYDCRYNGYQIRGIYDDSQSNN